MNPRLRLLLLLLAPVLAAGAISCLFSFFLPTSASLLAPTASSTPTITLTPTVTPTNTITPTANFLSGLHPTPPDIGTPFVQIAAYSQYMGRDLWQAEAGPNVITEDFESDPVSYSDLAPLQPTGKSFRLTSADSAQLIIAPELLPTGNLLLFRDWENGLTIVFPENTSAKAFGFNYTASEEWKLVFNDVIIPLQVGNNLFIGFVLYQNFPQQFTLLGPSTAQHGLAVDNISYVP